MTSCRLCSASTRVTHSSRILRKYDVAYFVCKACDFWFTEEPYWLDEAYSNAIAATDTGLVQRNLELARRLPRLLDALAPEGPYVDWAGGHGLLVRLMRDAGYEFLWQDRYAENVLARGYEWERHRAGRTASAVTAIEALEHAPDPVGFLAEIRAGTGADTIIFTQELHPEDFDVDWWYLAPVAGQHVSFYGSRTLDVLADRLGLRRLSAGTLHAFTAREMTQQEFTRAADPNRIGRLRPVRRRPSLTLTDHAEQTARLG